MKSRSLRNVCLMATFVSAVAVISSCGNGSQQTQQAPPPTIATITVQPTVSDLSTSLPATIKGKTDIAIRPQVTGFITKVHVDEGQQVKKGQLLFTLDQVQYEAAVDQAAASVNVAQTAVDTQKLTVANKKRLLDKNIISQYEYQMAANSLAQAQAQLAQANAALVNARKNLAYTMVTAPSDGVVGSIPNREGSLASPSSAQPLTTISDNSQVYAYFSMNEKEMLSLTDGGKYSLNSRIGEMQHLFLVHGEICIDLRVRDAVSYRRREIFAQQPYRRDAGSEAPPVRRQHISV